MAKHFQYRGQKYEIVLKKWEYDDERIRDVEWCHSYGVNADGEVVCRSRRHFRESVTRRNFTIPYFRDTNGVKYPLTREFLEGYVNGKPTTPPRQSNYNLLCSIGGVWIPPYGWGEPEHFDLSGEYMTTTPEWDDYMTTAYLLMHVDEHSSEYED